MAFLDTPGAQLPVKEAAWSSVPHSFCDKMKTRSHIPLDALPSPTDSVGLCTEPLLPPRKRSYHYSSAFVIGSPQ